MIENALLYSNSTDILISFRDI
jgi:hypothetical protein